MKKIYFILSLFAAIMSFSCVQPNNTSSENGSTETITPGWYLYTTNADSNQPQKTFLYINSNGAIERAGSASKEYSGTQLEMLQNQLSYSICKKNQDGTFITFSVTDAPSWGTIEQNNDNDEVVCPYPEGEYLDVTKHSTFSWPVNKNLQLWSAKENNYTCGCSVNIGYINNGNTFIVGTLLSAGDCIKFRMEDTDNNRYSCIVYFTAAENNNNNTQDNSDNTDEINLETGYEWWCFEDAYLGPLDGFVLYDVNGNPVRAGTSKSEATNSLYLQWTKEEAVNNFRGTVYKVTDLTQLPSWCY